MQQLVQIPTWLRKTPFLGKFMRPVGLGEDLKKSDKDLILKIVQQFKDQSRKDIKQWREAEEAFDNPENPRTWQLQDLLDYLSTNAQLGTAIDIRFAATLGTPFVVYSRKTGKADKDKTELLKQQWFFKFMWNFLYTVTRGYTVAQLSNAETMEFQYIPRRNVIPQKNMVVFEVEGEKGVNYTEPPFDKTVISLVHNNPKGILNDIIPNLIWMKNARESWNEFSEKFGIPLVTAETNKTNEKDLDKIDFWLKNLGEAATGIFPIGTKITVHDQATKGDPYNVFLKQIELDMAMISKRLLGGTMLTDNGSSKSQSEVHERVHESLVMFDKAMMTFLVNDQLFKMMPAFGDDDAFKFDDSEKLNLSDSWKIVKEMIEVGFDLPIEWVSEKFDVPLEAFTKKTTPTDPGNSNNKDENFKKATKAMAAAMVAKGIALPNYKPTCGHVHSFIPVADGFTDTLLSELSDELINLVWGGKETLIAEVLKAITTHRKLLDGLLEGWGDRFMDITYDATDVHCLAAMEYNLFEFSRLKEAANVFALNELKMQAQNFNEFRDLALPYLKNADQNWLRSEYNYTIAVGQNASRYHQYMSEADTIAAYGIIQTVGDSRVRASHQLLDGKIVSFKEKGGMSIWPPFDIGCRCEILQYLGKVDKDKLLTSSDIYDLIDKKPGDKWTGNRGDSEQVFAKNEMYMKDHGIATEVNKMPYSKYKLKPYDEVKDNYKSMNLDKSITKKNVKELFKPVEKKDYMGFEDYLGRKLILKRKIFDEHTTNEKYLKQNRHQLFAKINEVLSDPDEVYYFKFNKGNFQTKYVKFYNDGAIVVPTNLGSENVEINSWYNMDNEDGTRRGYLIHKKSDRK